MFLDGGNMFQSSAANSLYLYCESNDEIERVHKLLSNDGKVKMKLGNYGWSKKYSSITDKYGIDWQLDVDEVRSIQKIIPSLLFTNDKKERISDAISRYTSIFQDHRKLMAVPYPAESNVIRGTIMFAQLYLQDQIFQMMSSDFTNDFDFTEGMSYVVECDDQEQIDHYWQELSTGGNEGQCGWLKDEFGISWQIIPAKLGSIMHSAANPKKIIEALMKMKKLKINELVRAGEE